MNNLSVRSNETLYSVFEKLRLKVFNENDVKDLLIQLRPIFNKNELIYEIANFVTHPEERDRGICHRYIDIIYSKLLYVHANSDQKSINPLAIPQNIFETFIIGSLETYPDNEFKKKLTKDKIHYINFIKSLYKKRNGIFYLNEPRRVNESIKIIDIVIRRVEFDVAIDTKLLINQIIMAIREVISLINYPYSFLQEFDNISKEILVCIFCLISSARFRLFDNTYADSYLSFHGDKDYIESMDIKKWDLCLNGRIYINKAIVSFPLMILKGDVTNFLPSDFYPEKYGLRELPFYHVFRDNNNNLKMMKKL